MRLTCLTGEVHLEIRPAEIDDAGAIARVHVTAWQEAYRGLVPQAYPTAGELWAMYVSPSQWGTGVGNALMEATIDELQRIESSMAYLWVLEGNSRAIGFYERHGWRADGATTVFEAGGAQIPEARYARPISGS